ncbi:MAG: Mut7-C RNAse domain-containing protein [Candidatus Bathyarchaeia archaeon]
MRFITDGMLGKLTRWLRMLGHDVDYYRAAADKQLLDMAKSENRILLTRDLKLYKRAVSRGIDAVLVKATDDIGKLADLARLYNFSLGLDLSVSRCPKCNGGLNAVLKVDVADMVPELTAKYYDDFWRCTVCGQIYWCGAHWKRITQTLDEVARKVGAV